MIEEEIKSRIPLIKDNEIFFLKSILEHPNAPKWNYECGDRLQTSDIEYLEEFSKKLEIREKRNLDIPEKILTWVKKMTEESILFYENSKGVNIKEEFQKIKPMYRKDISTNIEKIVPKEISLNRILVNSTSGTTGEPIKIPGRPDHIGTYIPLLLFALKRNEIEIKFEKEKVNCIMICYQENTAIYSTIHSYLNGSGFSKINLHKNSWRREEDRIIFLESYDPELITGDPVSFSELLKLDIKIKPKALVSTSMELNEILKNKLEEKFQTKVIDFFSSNETGPLFYKCKYNEFHLLPNDVHLEITNEKNENLAENELGEITITGGRNPFLPLLRYKTSDFGKIDFSFCKCGDQMPKVKNLLTRKFVLFENLNSEIINPIDLVQVMKENPVLQFQFIQDKDLKLRLNMKTIYELTNSEIKNMEGRIQKIFQTKIDLKIFQNYNFEKEKVINFIKKTA